MPTSLDVELACTAWLRAYYEDDDIRAATEALKAALGAYNPIDPQEAEQETD